MTNPLEQAVINQVQEKIEEMLHAQIGVQRLSLEGKTLFRSTDDGANYDKYAVVFYKSPDPNFIFPVGELPPGYMAVALASVPDSYEIGKYPDGTFAGTIRASLEEVADGTFLEHCKVMIQMLAGSE